MIQSPASRKTSIWSLLILSILVCGACSILDPEDVSIEVKNRTESSIYFQAWDLEASHLVDLSASGRVTPNPAHILRPGASRVLRPWEVSGDFQIGNDLRIFIYEVLGDLGEYRSMVTLTGEQLRRLGHDVTITSF